MPGSKELEFFRNELSKLGNEREVMKERGEAYEDLPLPSPSSSDMPSLDVDNLLAGLGDGSAGLDSRSGEAVGVDGLNATAGSGDSPDSSGSDASDQSDFDKLLANLSLDGGVEDSFNVPDDLLAGLSAGIEADRAAESSGFVDEFSQAEELPAGEELLPSDDLETVPGDLETPSFDMPSFELPSLDQIDSAPADMMSADTMSADLLSGADASVEDAGTDLESVGEAGIEDLRLDELVSDESLEPAGAAPEGPASLDEALESLSSRMESLETPTAGDSFEIPDFSSFEMPSFGGDSAGASMPSADIPGLEDGEVLDSAEIPGSTESPESADSEPFEMDITPISDDYAGPPPGAKSNAFGPDFADFSVPPDLSVPENEPAEPVEIDGFDGFSLDEEFLKAGSAQASPDEDFHIPGFSDFTSSPVRPSLSEIPSEPEAMKRGGKKDIPLSITEDDFRRLFETLATFPLNVRIACQEYITSDEGTELKKMELVHWILTGVSVRKIARSLETLLDRSIPVPKDFEKKSFADYELEKASLRYVFLNKILPAAIMFTGIAILTACTVFLSWNFIYRPLAAESLYKRGFAAIGDARYAQSTALFDQAVQVWEKKKWYFRYAREYRRMKQYIMAETMYERLLARYDNDLKGGLEYALMLSAELRNFEKAETVLRRRVLDHHVNDREGLLLLGDNFLEWAYENPDKYAEARSAYAVLIELYGPQDLYLSRMMRYFIRVDNLAEVLPLKERLTRKRGQISPEDLVELSGYFVDKRYEPGPQDSEALRSRIEDVRALLDRAIKVAGGVAEAHYNMGRFFIYNYKPDQASVALSESLRLFESADYMNPRRTLTRIDAMRLLGEIRSEDKEYVKASALFADAISLYEEQRANRAVRQDRRVGVLYADWADIDYFISNDLPSALSLYTKALAELHDTPSVRYRIGYIHYQGGDWLKAMDYFADAYSAFGGDRNLSYGFANALFRRGDYFAAQGHYERLMESLEAERIRKGIVFPQTRIDHASFVELYMKSANNLGVTLNRVAKRTGDSSKNARALSLLAESARAWDALTRNPDTLMRAQGSNLAAENVRYLTHPRPAFETGIYGDIPKTLEGERVLQQREDR